MSIGEIILNKIKCLREKYINTGDETIFYELEGISSIANDFSNEKIIPLLDSLNIKREIDSLFSLIIGHKEEKVNV